MFDVGIAGLSHLQQVSHSLLFPTSGQANLLQVFGEPNLLLDSFSLFAARVLDTSLGAGYHFLALSAAAPNGRLR